MLLGQFTTNGELYGEPKFNTSAAMGATSKFCRCLWKMPVPMQSRFTIASSLSP